MPTLRNDQTIDQLKSEFQETYDSSFAWESAISAHLALPNLVGFWPMSGMGSQSATTDAREISGSELHLTNAGVQFGALSTWPLLPLANFGVGGTDRLYRTDEALFYIAGNEAQLLTSHRGLTMGCWARNTELGTAGHSIIGQWDDSGNDRSYLIYQDSTSGGRTLALVSDNGTNVGSKIVSNSTLGIADDEWHHYVLQWSPSSQDDYIRLWVDGQYWETASVGYASLHNSSANFGIGHSYSSGSPGYHFEGQISMAFLCRARVFDSVIKVLYFRTRSLFQSREKWIT